MKFLRNSKEIKEYRDDELNLCGNIDELTHCLIDKPVLDHDHSTGHVRTVLDYNSNQMLGKIESAWKRFGYKHGIKALPDFLNRVALYLQKDYSNNPYHPNHIKKLLRQFNSKNKEDQYSILSGYGLYNDEIMNTKILRLKQYKKLLLNENTI